MSLGPKSNFIPVVYAGTKKKKKDDNGDGFISGKMDDGKLKSFLKGIGLKDGGPTNIDGLALTGRTRANRS